jgi:hypothetical protein
MAMFCYSYILIYVRRAFQKEMDTFVFKLRVEQQLYSNYLNQN